MPSVNKKQKNTKTPKSLNAEQQAFLTEILETELRCIEHPSFKERNAYKKLFEEAEELPNPDSGWYAPGLDLDDSRLPRSTNSLLNIKQEQVIFLQFNYARFKALAIWNRGQKRKLSIKESLELLKWHELAQHKRAQIVACNLGLVLAMSRRMPHGVDAADVFSDSHLVLIRAIDGFDVSRGFKFSTYACRSILRAMGRLGESASKRRKLSAASLDESWQQNPDMAETPSFLDDLDQKDALHKLQHILNTNAAELSDVEKTIIEHRFPIEEGKSRWLTLQDLGRLIGYTKERTRQLQSQALLKLRKAMDAPMTA